MIYPSTSAANYYHLDYGYYNGSNRLRDIRDNSGQLIARFSRHSPTGQIGRIQFGNSVVSHYSYGSASQLLHRIQTVRGGGHLLDRAYTYSAAGDITRIIDGRRQVTHDFDYDHLHRLIASRSNRTTPVTPLVLDYTYDDSTAAGPLHAPAEITVNTAPYLFDYDANGNMTSGWDFSDPNAPIQRTIDFNPENMAAEITRGSSRTTFLYDAEGRRVRKRQGGSSTYYVDDVFEVKDGNFVRYIFAGNLRIAMRENDRLTYFHKDHLGSSSVLTDASGNELESADYLPFGGQRSAAAIARSDYTFTDQEIDRSTGLYNYDARLYDPIVGQFVSADSIIPDIYDPQSWNRYAYVRNNPIKYVDPSGHSNDDYNMEEDKGEGYNGFGGLGIGNPGSYGGDNNISAPGHEFGYWDGSRESARFDYGQPNINGITYGVHGNMPEAGAFPTGQIGIDGGSAAMTALEAGLAASGLRWLYGAYAYTTMSFLNNNAGAGGAPESVGNSAHNAANATRLNKSLTSQAQMGEAGKVMAGPGARTPFRDASRVAREYGGRASDWVKKTSTPHTARDGVKFETHWVENIRTGQRVEFKTKFIGSN